MNCAQYYSIFLSLQSFMFQHIQLIKQVLTKYNKVKKKKKKVSEVMKWVDVVVTPNSILP